MSHLYVEVPGLPLPQGSKRAVRNVHTNKLSVIDNNPRLAQWRMQITNYTRQEMAEWGEYPIKGAIAIQIGFFLPRPLSHYGTGKNAGVLKANAPEYPTHAPDLDKLERAILDGCTDAGTWLDDAQVVDIISAKRYADRGVVPGAHFAVILL